MNVPLYSLYKLNCKCWRTFRHEKQNNLNNNEQGRGVFFQTIPIATAKKYFWGVILQHSVS